MRGPVESYQIKNAKTPILLDIIRITDLKLHEEVIPDHLKRIVDLLRRDPFLHHPIVTDRETGLVLDGNHRLEAIKTLGCKLAPCAIIDYRNIEIRIDRWFRTLENINLEDLKQLVEPRQTKYQDPKSADRCLSTRNCFATVEKSRSSLVFPTRIKDPVKLTRASFEIEQIARSAKLNVSYVSRKEPRPPAEVIMSTISLRKEEVLEAARKNRTFPPKTTRHVIPSRPLGLEVPLAWLRRQSFERERGRFLKMLQNRKVTRKPPGSSFGSRQYEEEIFVFD